MVLQPGRFRQVEECTMQLCAVQLVLVLTNGGSTAVASASPGQQAVN